ncbi:transglycosylase domain-containing protein, partial [Actinophytocola sp.]|uniref:transglycosylase domain-containing protein n=1 Tax=Actinophytocola sp. TaxID=1872138 RepID=UPI003D6B3448
TEEPPARPGSNGARSPAGQSTRVVHPRPAGTSRPSGPGDRPRPGGIPDGPTEHLPPVHGFTGPEPELLTHRELDYDDDSYDDEDYDPRLLTGAQTPLTEEQRHRRRRKIWRRVRRTAYVGTALMIIGPMVAFFIAYQLVEVPSPESVRQQQGQVVTLQFANGKPMGKVVPQGGENRTLVKYEDIPETVLHAVYAAEDADFETNPGFDIGGVLRAGWNQLSGGEGGGSTITQQYVKKATGKEEKTVTRKALEVVTAYKMNNTYPKEDIITAYLNTVYFGRSAYGVSAAAQAYFNKPLEEISASEAALLAGMIQNPSRYDEQDYMERRWNYVMDQMVANGWFPAQERANAEFPTMSDVEDSRPDSITGARAHIKNAVIRELDSRYGITEDELFQKGYTVKTTIDPRAQKMAEASVRKVMGDEPKNIRPALVAVDPKSGAVRAYYGGSNGVGLDWAATPQEPGSSFKPFDLVALLEKGKGLGETYDGTNERTFDGRKSPVRNAGGESCGEQCTVAEAMRRSINTVFYDIAVNDVGTNKVLSAARQAGITSDLNGEKDADTPPDGNIAIGGGDTRVTTLEMASAYATFAADGMYRKPYLVSEVLWPDGGVVKKVQPEEKRAFDPDEDKNSQIARNVTESLEPVIEFSDLECAQDRPCAGKTGTHQFGATEDNSKAWMVGYTPQISTAVSMGAEKPNGKQMPLRNGDGGIVYGSGLPGEIWEEFMELYHEKLPAEQFGPFEPIGEDYRVSEEPDDEDEDENRDDDRDDNNGNGDGNGNDDGNGNGNDDGNGNGDGNDDGDGDGDGSGDGDDPEEPSNTPPPEEPSLPFPIGG